MGTVLRSSAGGHGLAVLLTEQDRLTLWYSAGYEGLPWSLRHPHRLKILFVLAIAATARYSG
jgi:hypothetical protein